MTLSDWGTVKALASIACTIPVAVGLVRVWHIRAVVILINNSIAVIVRHADNQSERIIIMRDIDWGNVYFPFAGLGIRNVNNDWRRL